MKMRSMKFWLKWLLLPTVLLLCWWLMDSVMIDPDGSQPTTVLPARPSVSKPTSLGTVPAANTADAPAKDNSPADLDPALCVTADSAEQQLRQILQQRKQQSHLLIQHLLQSGTKTAEVATMIHQLGGDMVLLAQQRPDYPANPNTLIRFEQTPRTIPRSMMLLVMQATQSQNYQQVVAALQSDPAPEQLAWHGQTLLTAILAADLALSSLTLQQLIDSGLQPVFADLVAATALQLPVPLVDTLNMAFHGDRQQLWFHQYRRNNLTLQAAADGNQALYDYWLAQGVPALISASDLNAFDLLPFPATETELQQRLPLIRSFIKQGLLPRQFTQLTSWLLLLPKDDALLLSQQLTSDQHKKPASLATHQNNQQHLVSAAALSDEIIAINHTFKAHIAKRQQCEQLYQLGTLLLSLDDADQHYGTALKASFQVNSAQVAATIQLLNQQQQLELLLAAKQWQSFIGQAQEQLQQLSAELRSNYILEQLLQYQAPPEVMVSQLHRHYRRFGVPPPALLSLLQQMDNPQLQAQIKRLPWWRKIAKQ
jgi:hypothetical protein